MRGLTSNHTCTECGAYLPHAGHLITCSYWSDLEADRDLASRPGMFDSLAGWAIARVGLCMGISLVGWLIALALAAMLLLPGCSVDEEARSRAHSALERQIELEAKLLVEGKVDLATFLADTKAAIAAFSQAEQQAGGVELPEVLGGATLVSGAIAVAQQLLRNRSRKAELDQVTAKIHERIDALEEKGGAA